MIKKFLAYIFSKTKEKPFSTRSGKDPIQYIYSLDYDLKKEENLFKEKLDDFFKDLLLLTLLQSNKIEKTSQIFYGKKKIIELEVLFNNYFNKIDKIAHNHNLKLLDDLIPKPNKLNKNLVNKARRNFNTLKAHNNLLENKEYSRELASKEIKDLKGKVLKLLKETAPTSKNISTEQLIKKAFNDFGKRTKNIASTEANRATNLRIATNAEKSKYVNAIQFVAVLDDRTTDICWSRNGLIVSIEYFNRFMKPPLHYHCRSVGLPLGKWNRYELSNPSFFTDLPPPWWGKTNFTYNEISQKY